MPRASADLHYAIAIDREIHEASKVDPSLLDPVVRIDGGLPGVARPFRVVRDYQGPQGGYGEHFVLRDHGGRELARSSVRRIELKGEMFEDRFTTELADVVFRDAREHTLTFYVNDDEVGSVPVFLELAEGGDPRVAAEETFKKAAAKSTIMWLAVRQPDGREHSQPVWFVWDKTDVWVLTGPGEQQVPNLVESSEVDIIVRGKDTRSLLTRVPAAVEVVGVDDSRYPKIIDSALANRLNMGSLDAAQVRWRESATLLRLSPQFRDAEAEAAEAAARPTAGAATAGAPGADAAGAAAAEPSADEPKVEAGEIDQETYDKLIAEGKSERIARAKAKAAFVRKEKARLKADAGA